jgi:acetolactate synthase-1/2/3 large subunit
MSKFSEVMVDTLKQAGIRVVFGIPSIHNIGLYDAFRNEPSIRHILCRHESSATHMADGYGRSGIGSPGVVITSTGPGAGYMVSPLMEAWWSSSPVLAITSNVRSDKIDKGLGTLHETYHQDKIFRNITKATVCARNAEDVRTLTKEAVRTAVSGRPGPVYLEVPTDLWDQEVQTGREEHTVQAPRAEDTGGLDKAVSLLKQASCPVIIAGTEAVRAGIGSDVTALAEILSAPVVTVSQGKGIIPEDHPLSFGNVGRRGTIREMLRSSDVTLALGSKLREVDYRRRGLTLSNLIHVDWDGCWVGKNFATQVQLVGDIPEIAHGLKKQLETGDLFAASDRIKTLRKDLDQEMEKIRETRIEITYLDTLRNVLPRDGDLVIDNTLLGYWAEFFYPSYRPGGFVAAKGSSVIGFAFPAAMGLKLACPDRAVVAVMGDGGFFYCSNELATCVRHHIGFPLIVVNDKAYGVIDALQHLVYGEGHETSLVNPDLTAYVRSFGVNAVRVDSPGGLGEAVDNALKSKEMWVIELVAMFPETPFALY